MEIAINRIRMVEDNAIDQRERKEYIVKISSGL